MYTCNAFNPLLGTTELVTVTLLISNPNEDGTCHNLDVDMIEVL